MKKMSVLALIGYFAGIGTYWAQEQILGGSEEVEEMGTTEIVEARAEGVISDETTVHLDTEMFIGTKTLSEGEEATEEHAVVTEAVEEAVTEEVVYVMDTVISENGDTNLVEREVNKSEETVTEEEHE